MRAQRENTPPISTLLKKCGIGPTPRPLVENFHTFYFFFIEGFPYDYDIHIILPDRKILKNNKWKYTVLHLGVKHYSRFNTVLP